MKKVNVSLFSTAFAAICLVLGAALFTSCQEDPDVSRANAPSSSESIAKVLQSDQKIAYLAENFDTEMDQASVAALAEAYDNLTLEELHKFYDLEAKQLITQGADSTVVLLSRDYRQAVNQRGQELYELTAANLSEAQLEVATREVQKYPRFAEAIRKASGASDNARSITLCNGSITWDNNPNIRVESQESYPTAFSYSTVGFVGQYTFCSPQGACQEDCDLVFYSYYQGTSPQLVWASTPRARKVLTWKGTNSLDTYYGSSDDGRNYVMIGIGLGRLNYYYIDPLSGATASNTFLDLAQTFASRLYVGSL